MILTYVTESVGIRCANRRFHILFVSYQQWELSICSLVIVRFSYPIQTVVNSANETPILNLPSELIRKAYYCYVLCFIDLAFSTCTKYRRAHLQKQVYNY